MKIQEIGMIGLVYSLIYQLLQFRVEDEERKLGKDSFGKLDGLAESFEEGLKIPSELLRKTPVKFCIIDQLNDMEWGDTSE